MSTHQTGSVLCCRWYLIIKYSSSATQLNLIAHSFICVYKYYLYVYSTLHPYYIQQELKYNQHEKPQQVVCLPPTIVPSIIRHLVAWNHPAHTRYPGLRTQDGSKSFWHKVHENPSLTAAPQSSNWTHGYASIYRQRRKNVKRSNWLFVLIWSRSCLLC